MVGPFTIDSGVVQSEIISRFVKTDFPGASGLRISSIHLILLDLNLPIPFLDTRACAGFRTEISPGELSQNSVEATSELFDDPQVGWVVYVSLARLWSQANEARNLPNALTGDVDIRVIVQVSGIYKGQGAPANSQDIVFDVRLLGLARPAIAIRNLRLEFIEIKPDIRFDDTRHSTLIVSRPHLSAGMTRLEIELDEAADFRLDREILFAFELSASASGQRAENAAIRTTITTRRAGADRYWDDTPPLILCEVGERLDGWRLKPVSRIALRAGGSASTVEERSLTCFLPAARRYAICLDLHRLEFDIRTLFGTDEKLDVQVSCGAPPEERVLDVTLGLKRTNEPYILLSELSSDRAVRLAGGKSPATAADPFVMRLMPSNEGLVTFCIAKFTHETVTIRYGDADPPDGLASAVSVPPHESEPPLTPFLSSHHVITIPSTTIFDPIAVVFPVGCIYIVRIQSGTVHQEDIVGLDLGTMSVAVALCDVHGGPKLLRLGQRLDTLLRMAGGVRREADDDYLATSASGLSVPDTGNASHVAVPAQFLLQLGGTVTTDRWLTREEEMLHRAEYADSPFDLHVPLLERAHEYDPDVHGIAALPSVKTAACLGEYVPAIYAERLSNPMVFSARKVGDVWTPEALPMYEIKSGDLLTAAVRVFINGFVKQAWNELGANTLRSTVLVATYPPSISEEAKQRYRAALESAGRLLEKEAKDLVKLRPPPSPATHIVPESLAACYALGRENDSFWGDAGGDGLDRLVLFDFGAGTIDVSAVEFNRSRAVSSYEGHAHRAEPGRPRIVSQCVCFSVPLAGNVLDEALLFDIKAAYPLVEAFNGSRGSPSWHQALGRIEDAKRRIVSKGKETWLIVALDTEDVRRVPRQGDRFRYAPVDFDQGLFGPPQPGENERDWVALKLTGDEGAEEPKHLKAYCDAVKDFVVDPTLANCGTLAPTYAKTHLALAGRASNFRPLADRIRDAATEHLREKCAFEGLPESYPDTFFMPLDPAYRKRIVAEGAVIWAQEESAARLEEFLPRPSYVEANFAFVVGTIDEHLNFSTIDRVIDLGDPIWLEPVAGFDRQLHLAMRPPYLSEEKIKAWLGSQSDFSKSLLHRSLRPIHCIAPVGRASGRNPSVGSVEPYGSNGNGNGSSFVLALAKQRVAVAISHLPDAIHATVQTGEEPLRTIRLASTFVI